MYGGQPMLGFSSGAVPRRSNTILPPRVSSWPRLCENAKTLNRDRTSYSFEIVLGAQIASPFNFENELKNIILVALRVFEFSHSLGPMQTS
jgi:hypothetical protein